MARPAHTLITWSGLIGSDNAEVEEFSFSLRAVGAPDPDLTNLNAQAVAAMGAWADNFAPETGDNLAVTKVVVANVGAGGNWLLTPAGEYQKGEWTGEIRGQQASNPFMPAQAALCISLNTARAGASGKGRFFYPLGRMVLESSGRLSAVRTQGFADYASAMIQDLNTVFGDIAVVSSKGYSSKVTSVRVGRVVDTIRSRRRDIAEEYKTSVVPT